MRLLEAVIDANHRAAAGDASAGLHPGDFEDALPLVALTCVDARLNALLPQVLGVPSEQFICISHHDLLFRYSGKIMPAACFLFTSLSGYRTIYP